MIFDIGRRLVRTAAGTAAVVLSLLAASSVVAQQAPDRSPAITISRSGFAALAAGAG